MQQPIGALRTLPPLEGKQRLQPISTLLPAGSLPGPVLPPTPYDQPGTASYITQPPQQQQQPSQPDQHQQHQQQPQQQGQQPPQQQQQQAPPQQHVNGYYSPPMSRRTSSNDASGMPMQYLPPPGSAGAPPHYTSPPFQQTPVSHPMVNPRQGPLVQHPQAQAPGMPGSGLVSELDLPNRLGEIQETASHLYHFSASTKNTITSPPRLDNLHALMARVRSASDFLEHWYQRLYQDEQLRSMVAPPYGVGMDYMMGMKPDDDFSRNGGRRSSDGESKRAKKRARNSVGGIRCHLCGVTETPEWRRGPDGSRTLCNACGLYHAKLVKKKGEAEAAEVLRERREARMAGVAAAAAQYNSTPVSPKDMVEGDAHGGPGMEGPR